MSTLGPLMDTPSLDKLAYERIKQAILTFEFLPNQNLVEGELAGQLRISKTPVRDALMRLEREGLVTRQPYKGTFVTDVTKQDMINIFEIRICLEGLAVRLAAKSLTEEDFSSLQMLVDQHEKALQAQDYSKASEINGKFHHVIYHRCSNQRLQDMLRNLEDHLTRYRLLSVSQGMRSDKSVAEHQAILDALLTGDIDKAVRGMEDHLTSAMNDLYVQDFEELEQAIHRVRVNAE